MDIYIFLRRLEEIRKQDNRAIIPAFVATNRSILIRTLELKIGNPRTPGDLFIGERTSRPGFLPSSRSFDASSVLSRIQFGHCPWFYLQRGITIAVVYGWTALDVRGTGRRPLALILYRTLYPRSLPRPASSSPPSLPPNHRPHHRRPPQPLDEQEFSILSSAVGKAALLGACCSSVLLSGSWNQQEWLRRHC